MSIYNIDINLHKQTATGVNNYRNLKQRNVPHKILLSALKLNDRTVKINNMVDWTIPGTIILQ